MISEVFAHFEFDDFPGRNADIYAGGIRIAPDSLFAGDDFKYAEIAKFHIAAFQ